MLEYFRSWYNLVQKFVRVWKKLIINVIVSAENYIRSRYKSVLFDIEKEKKWKHSSTDWIFYCNLFWPNIIYIKNMACAGQNTMI